jgi:hypothetical protein
MKRVIVVGNGPSALEHELGSVVDDFDVVVRFNDYKTAGFEKWIGSRTTIWVASDNMLPGKDMSQIDEALFVPLPRLCRDNHRNVQRFRKAYRDKLVEVSPEEQKKIYDWYDLDLYAADKWPTTGAIAVRYLIERYGSVAVYGFDFFADGAKGDIHYWGDSPKGIQKALQTGNGFRHDLDKEEHFFRVLESARLLTVLRENL